VVVAYLGQANSEIWSKCVSQYCKFHSFQSHHKNVRLPCSFSTGLLQTKGMFICSFGWRKSKNNKFLQSLACPQGNFIVQTVIWNTGFVGQNYNVNTNVLVYFCMVCC